MHYMRAAPDYRAALAEVERLVDGIFARHGITYDYRRPLDWLAFLPMTGEAALVRLFVECHVGLRTAEAT